MLTPSQDRIQSAIERIVARGETVTNRSVLDELLAMHGTGASFGTIGPLVRTWHADHPAASRSGRSVVSAREGGRRHRTVDAAVAALVDQRIAEQRDEDVRTMNALRREIADLTLLLRTVLDALAQRPHAADPQPPRPRRTRTARTGEDSGNGLANPTRSTPVPKAAQRPSAKIATARSLGRSVVEAVFDVLVSHGKQMPSHPAMKADEIIAALPASLCSQIAVRIGRAPDRRYLTRLLQPRIERERYVRRDTDGRYIAIPDWRRHRERAGPALAPA